MTGQHPRPEEYPNAPDVDIRDAFKEYLVEIEVPGISHPDQLSVVWTSNHSAIVVGDIKRPEYEGATDISEHLKNDNDDLHKFGTRDAHGQYKDNEKATAILLVGERKVGPFRRYFTFPAAVNHDEASIKLEAGLLKLGVPKHAASQFKTTKAKVQAEGA